MTDSKSGRKSNVGGAEGECREGPSGHCSPFEWQKSRIMGATPTSQNPKHLFLKINRISKPQWSKSLECQHKPSDKPQVVGKWSLINFLSNALLSFLALLLEYPQALFTVCPSLPPPTETKNIFKGSFWEGCSRVPVSWPGFNLKFIELLRLFMEYGVLDRKTTSPVLALYQPGPAFER